MMQNKENQTMDKKIIKLQSEGNEMKYFTKSFFILFLVFLTLFSFLINSVYARTLPPPPDVFYGVFINDKTQECSVVKIEDRFSKYEYSSEFKLNKTFSEYESVGRLKKLCTTPKGLLDCELAEDGNDDFCKSEYQRLTGSNAGYDGCKLTHERCTILDQTNVVIGHLDYVELKPSKTVLKSSAISKYAPMSGFLIFTFIILPLFNLFIRIKKIFSNKVRNLILALSILYWIVIILIWLLGYNSF